MGDKSGAWDEHRHKTTYKIDNQQGQRKECHSMFCDNLYVKKNLKKNEYTACVSESLFCTPETNRAL